MSKRVSFFANNPQTADDLRAIEQPEIAARFQRQLELAMEQLRQAMLNQATPNNAAPTTPTLPPASEENTAHKYSYGL